MTDAMPNPAPMAAPTEDRTLPAVAYGLYLLGLANVITIFIGLFIAYANRRDAGPVMASHYTFQIRTFWLSIGWFVIGGLLLLFGIPLSFVLIGIPAVLLGVFIMGVVWIWFAVRCVLGVIYLARGEAYPRPLNWLI
ncbi:MAG: hypothetical protein Q8L59_15800 [Phenylobacterium sp.]|uniref:DUF4870 family protein n=1 Tax=Phenylobacterium sp. TaxID=1871053 RepID=UPI002735BF99|nr:hypothetical protein [Phenylobacterium sp.]MDP1643638.1 hypothetical protein [Phenylobacterium sp.]MDP3117073.1 hypothetical protein [Phenylobacterium sp.]MDP3381786.1 hypothetical protein [Phenylobacterium sp.]